MTNILIRKLIGDEANASDPQVRQRCGTASGIVGIVLNLLLFAGKLLAGLFSGSIAIMADAFNNLSDAGSSVVTLIGFRLAGRKPDAEHPFGHGRIEYLAGLIVSLLILLVGFELGKSSVEKIIHPEPVELTVLGGVILLAAVAVKLWMGVFNRKLGRRIDSAAMLATAADSTTDALATAVVFLCSLIATKTGLQLDGWAGIAVALFILRAGWGAAKDTLDPLLGRSPEPELVKAIHAQVMSHPEILGLHDLVIHDYGPGRKMMSFHAEVPLNADIMAIHDVIDGVEKELFEKFDIETSIHMDPINHDDELTRENLALVRQIVEEIDPNMNVHDFRMTAGPHHTNLIFDVVVPYGLKMTDAQVVEEIKRRVSELENGPYFAVVQVDHSYV